MGFKARPSTYRISLAPTARASCVMCGEKLMKGAVRLETCAFVLPGRRTVLICHAACVKQSQAKRIVKVYGDVDRVPAATDVDESDVKQSREKLRSLSK